MSSGLDLGPVLDTAAAVLLSAMQTMGTLGVLIRPGARGAVDPETALSAPGEDVVLADEVPMIVVPDKAGSEQRVYPGNQQAPEPRWQIALPPEHVDLRRGDEIAVTASRDARLLGARFEVTVLMDNSAGAARMVLAKRVPVRGQT